MGRAETEKQDFGGKWVDHYDAVVKKVGGGLIVDKIVLPQCHFKLHGSSAGRVQIVGQSTDRSDAEGRWTLWRLMATTAN